MRVLRWRTSHRRQRGAVSIEMALLALPLMIFLLGIIELSMAFRGYVTITSAARSAVRVAATGADAGTCTTEAGDLTPCPAGNVPQLAQNAADAMARASRNLKPEDIRSVMIYKANNSGFPGTRTSMPDSCSGVTECVIYSWNPNRERFRYASGTWNPRTISACFPGTPSAPLNSVGVQVVARHDFMTGIFGSGITMADHAVMNFEPLPANECAANEHP